MEKIIAGRHMEVTDDMKQAIHKELDAIEGCDYKLTSVRVVLDKQKTWHYTEVILHGKNVSIESKAKSKDPYASMANAISKTEKQLKKYLDKLKDHHPHKLSKETIAKRNRLSAAK